MPEIAAFDAKKLAKQNDQKPEAKQTRTQNNPTQKNQQNAKCLVSPICLKAAKACRNKSDWTWMTWKPRRIFEGDLRAPVFLGWNFKEETTGIQQTYIIPIGISPPQKKKSSLFAAIGFGPVNLSKFQSTQTDFLGEENPLAGEGMV